MRNNINRISIILLGLFNIFFTKTLVISCIQNLNTINYNNVKGIHHEVVLQYVLLIMIIALIKRERKREAYFLSAFLPGGQ